MIVLSGAWSAYLLNARVRLGTVQAEAFISLIRFIRSEIECFAMPIPRALARCPRKLLEECGFSSAGAPESVEELLENINDGITRAHLERFCGEIGRGYRDEQLALCDYYITVLEERRLKLAEQLPMRKRINSALCLSGAFAIVIVLF